MRIACEWSLHDITMTLVERCADVRWNVRARLYTIGNTLRRLNTADTQRHEYRPLFQPDLGGNRMRTLDIVSSVDPAYGGPIEGVKQHAQIARTRGVYGDVVSLDDPGAPYVADFPETLHALGPALAAPGLGRYRYAPRLAPWLGTHAADYDAVIV